MLLIAIPTFESVRTECYAALWQAAQGHDADLACVTGYDCARARNVIAKKAMDGGFSHVLMVDSDVIIPPDAVDLLMDPPADIVLGFYKRKGDTLGRFEMFGQGAGWEMLGESDIDGAPDRIEVKGGGFGCAMVDVGIFKRLQFPWFEYEQWKDGQILSEDLHFSRIAANAGIKTYADTRVLCGHVGAKVWE